MYNQGTHIILDGYNAIVDFSTFDIDSFIKNIRNLIHES